MALPSTPINPGLVGLAPTVSSAGNIASTFGGGGSWLSNILNQYLGNMNAADKQTAIQSLLGFASEYNKGQGAEQQAAVNMAYNTGNNAADYQGNLRNEQLNRLLQQNAIGQQDPYKPVKYNAIAAMLSDYANGQNVGPDFSTSQRLPGLEHLGNIPMMRYNMGTSAPKQLTQDALMSALKNNQVSQMQANPNAAVTPISTTYGSAGSAYDQMVNQAQATQQEFLTTSQRTQLEEIMRGLKKGEEKKNNSALGSAATGAGMGAAFGPYGAAIGGIGGLLYGLFT